jgi:hypothetical protein
MSGNGSFVVLTLAERDRRFGRTRQFLKEHDLDCLIVGGFSSRV